MKIRQTLIKAALFFFIFSISFISVYAEEDEDIIFIGLELEKLVSFINGILALLLFVITFVSYKRDQRKRLLYVSIAFLLYGIKSFFVSSELFIAEIPWVDPFSAILDLVILFTFFYGILKK